MTDPHTVDQSEYSAKRALVDELQRTLHLITLEQQALAASYSELENIACTWWPPVQVKQPNDGD